MLLAAALAPHPPLLFTELVGPPGDLPEAVRSLLSSCTRAVERLVACRPETIVVIGAAEDSRDYDPRGALPVHRYGPLAAPAADGAAVEEGRAEGAEVLPLSLGVGSRLLDLAGWRGERRLVGLAADAPAAECAAAGREAVRAGRRVAVLAMGDGSARRGPKAPGHLDGRAAEFDAGILKALREADAGTLLAVDPALARELLAAGRPAWQALAGASGASGAAGDTAQAVKAEVLYSDDPYGVHYTVALWTPSPSAGSGE
ncbi:hypothetical protein GCM10023081_31010 [Arthrobacter ginkgonis]|uniref:Extradiol ring-cleavage dioxygenase class III enzyme subunit B domain-containing protein n=1 Tax=Arthrobacter ginkgonis TaxID=1630594 RepID=A0ABP7CIJ6_9MICC